MEKYSLSSDTYLDALTEMQKELYTYLDYADVSIITEDRKELKAHKHILSFCSPVFKDILSITKEQCPIIYLRGIQQSEMESILQFMYLGEASFLQDRMNEFLSVANNLQITEFHKNIEVDDNSQSQDSSEPEERSTENVPTNANSEVSQDPVPTFEGQSLVKPRNEKGRSGTCQPCEKYYADIKQHIQIKHSGTKYECQHCQLKCSTPAGLRIHIESKHEGAIFPCDQCDYTASSKVGVKHHRDSMHLGIRYACNECDMTFSFNHGLKRHIGRVH